MKKSIFLIILLTSSCSINNFEDSNFEDSNFESETISTNDIQETTETSSEVIEIPTPTIDVDWFPTHDCEDIYPYYKNAGGKMSEKEFYDLLKNGHYSVSATTNYDKMLKDNYDTYLDLSTWDYYKYDGYNVTRVGNVSPVSEVISGGNINIGNFSTDIDIFVAIDAPKNQYFNIGRYSFVESQNPTLIYPKDIQYKEIAKYFAAASVFNFLIPHIKINLYHVPKNDYYDELKEYQQSKGHLPHLLSNGLTPNELLLNGFIKDLSYYKNTFYYNMFDEGFLNQFNYGGFLTAFPIAIKPIGTLINKDEFIKWFMDSGHLYEVFARDFSYLTLYDLLDKNGTSFYDIDQDMLNYSEHDLYERYANNYKYYFGIDRISSSLNEEYGFSKHTAFDYSNGNKTLKEYYKDLTNNYLIDFLVDQQYTAIFNKNINLSDIGIFIDSYNKYHSDNISLKVDLLSCLYAYQIESMSVGNLCPIGSDNLEHCYSANAKKEMDIAATFAMFMALDPRAIDGIANISYFDNNILYKGDVSLPVCKKNRIFEFNKLLDLPVNNYKDNFEYQFALFFDLNNCYLKEGNTLNLDDYSNINEALFYVLDSIYMFNNIYEYERTAFDFEDSLRFYFEDGIITDVFEKWEKRHELCNISNDEYVENCLTMYEDLFEQINGKKKLVYEHLQAALDIYYNGNYSINTD